MILLVELADLLLPQQCWGGGGGRGVGGDGGMGERCPKALVFSIGSGGLIDFERRQGIITYPHVAETVAVIFRFLNRRAS